MIANVEVGTGIPTEEESEGYTGNGGMTMEYWYHYGAIIFWPKNIHIALLSKTKVNVILKWLKYFVRPDCSSREENSHYIKAILIDLVSKELEKEFLDFSIVAQALAKINDRNFIVEHGLTILIKVFDKVNVSHWLKLLKVHQDIDFSSLFLKIGNSNNISLINHLVKVLGFIKNKEKLNKFQLASLNIDSEIENICQSLLGIEIDLLNKNDNRYHYSYSDQPSRKKLIIELVSQLLEISQEKIISEKWEDAVVVCITTRLPREFTNQVLITNLLICKVKNSFFKKLYEKCYADLDLRVKTKPNPLPDWRREVPTIKSGINVWELLKHFLNSRTQKIFEYKKAMADRSEVENVIRNTTIDLEMKTIRRGSPHTLVIEKNNASYERKKDMWNEDVELLIKLKRLVS